MKKKSFEKKLLFNKSTVACLDAAQLDNARGGSDLPTKISVTCPDLTVCTESDLSCFNCPDTQWEGCSFMC